MSGGDPRAELARLEAEAQRLGPLRYAVQELASIREGPKTPAEESARAQKALAILIDLIERSGLHGSPAARAPETTDKADEWDSRDDFGSKSHEDDPETAYEREERQAIQNEPPLSPETREANRPLGRFPRQFDQRPSRMTKSSI